VIDLDAVENDIVRAGIGYWRRLKGGRAFPSRRQLVPRDIGDLMRNVVLLKVIADGEDYEFMIFGDAHARITGFNAQGSQLRDIQRVWPSMAEALQRVYGRVVETREAFALRAVRYDCPGRNPIAGEHVLLPLGKRDSTVDHILIFSVYTTLNDTRELAVSDEHQRINA
jgi:hypothetical protein